MSKYVTEYLSYVCANFIGELLVNQKKEILLDFITRALQVNTLHIEEFFKLRNMVANAIGMFV